MSLQKEMFNDWRLKIMFTDDDYTSLEMMILVINNYFHILKAFMIIEHVFY